MTGIHAVSSDAVLVEEKRERQEYIRSLARAMMTVFAPSPDAHGRLSGWAVDETGNKRVGSKQQYTIKRTPELKDYIYHLVSPQHQEPRGIGVYPINYQTKSVNFIVIDIDEDSERAKQAVMAMCELVKMRGGAPLVERTTQNRWHFWYIPEYPLKMLEAKYVALSLSYTARSFHVPVETYPATFHDAPLPRTGKYVNLPYRGACYTTLTGKQSGAEYEFVGKTCLLDPYRIEGRAEDDEESEGVPLAIFDLDELLRNGYGVSKDLEQMGKQLEQAQRKQEKQQREYQQKVRGNIRTESIHFDEILNALMKNTPRVGDRHACILAAAGVAYRQGVSADTATDRITECAIYWKKPGESRDWWGEVQRAVESTYSNGASGRVTGLPTLKRMGIIK